MNRFLIPPLSIAPRMGHRCWLLFLLLSMPWLTFAQCPTGNVTLSTQAQINAFPPGCVNFPGVLGIRGSDITDLSPLRNLESVGSDLLINNNPSLTSLTGLSSLTSVGASLRIESNSALSSLAALSSLTRTGGNLEINNNSSLTSLTGLSSLISVGFNLRIGNNSALSSLAALSSLTRTGNNLLIINNPSLTSLTGLSRLTSVGGDLRIEDNSTLSSLAALSSLTRTGNNLQINNNPSLTSLTGLSSLTSVAGNLRIVNNSNLSQCAIAVICQYLANPPRPVDISGNASGCAYTEDVQADCTPLVITTQPPSSSTVCTGATVTASVSTTGNARAYQWYRNGQVVSGQTTATLSLTNVQPPQAGAYVVVVSNSVSSLTSTAFSLTVNPTVSISPSSTAICQGQSATFSASGASSYQWRGPDGFISTGPTVNVSVAGTYSLTGTSSEGCSAMASATLTVNPTPTVSLGNDGPLSCTKTSVTLSSMVSPEVTYQWSGPGGFTSPASSVTTATAGSYTLIVTSPGGCSVTYTTSVEQSLTLAAPTLRTASGQASVSVPQYSGIVSLLIEGCSGTTAWSGPNNSSGTGTTIPVSTTQVGSLVYSATCRVGVCTSDPVSATVMVQAEPLKLLVDRYDCASRQLVLRTTGGNGQPLEYHINSVTSGWEPISNSFLLEAKHIGRELKLRSRQRQASGGWAEAEIRFTPTACGARQGVERVEVPFEVKVLGNPVVGEQVKVEVRGAEGQPLRLRVVNLQGRKIDEQAVVQPGVVERLSLGLGSGAGLYLLQVATPTQQQTVKVLKR